MAVGCAKPLVYIHHFQGSRRAYSFCQALAAGAGMCLPLGAPGGLLRREYSAFSASVLQPPGRAPSLQEGMRESITLFKSTRAHQQTVVLQKRRGNMAP